jgi:enoyl-CoA hydratase
MSPERILYEKLNGVAKVTINRPQVMNELDVETRRELLTALQDADADNNIRVVILTGAGGKAFSAGADLQMFRDMNSIEASRYVEFAKSVALTIESLGKPVIGVVDGYALGGGLELLLACDLVIASENSKFGQTELNVGAIPGVGGTQRLPRIVGIKKAKELVFTGSMIGAAEAEKLGLVNKVVPKEKLEETITQVVEKIRAKSSLIVRLAKEALNMSQQAGLSEGLSYESKLFALCFSTKDLKEGVNAFLEKRKPQFSGL